MGLRIDSAKGRQAAGKLHRAFATTGIHGRTDMPEDILPEGVERGSLEQLLFITFTVAIDYQRDASTLWASSRESLRDPRTRYLYSPQALHDTPQATMTRDMQRYALAKKPTKDAWIWHTIGVSFCKKWKGDPRLFLADCGWNAPEVLRRLKEDTHLERGRPVSDYPYLCGDKIGPLWLRMLRDNVGVTELRNLDRVPIPVDVHVARATLALGIVKGGYSGSLGELFRPIRHAWFESVRGLSVPGREMMALDVDEPLWHLSKYGCAARDTQSGLCPHIRSCEVREFCIPGTIKVGTGIAEVRT